ncbi:MAG: 30S ribosomal protein S9 [Candidatus Caenarcaniphilales bacterium]|nr:30S ribosomal protein S9 [Candidatus Caenarcaniphilales bacterium]
MKEATKKGKLDLSNTGKRKRAIARAVLVPGTGKITINGKTLEDYLGNRKLLQKRVAAPFEACGIKDSYDVVVKVTGGGPVGQSEAIMYAIAKSLASLNEGNKKTLKAAELLTRDARIKESKKYGRKKARKRFQFSKR